MWMTDPEKDLTFIFLSAGLIEGFDHFRRLSDHADLAFASVKACGCVRRDNLVQMY